MHLPSGASEKRGGATRWSSQPTVHYLGEQLRTLRTHTQLRPSHARPTLEQKHCTLITCHKHIATSTTDSSRLVSGFGANSETNDGRNETEPEPVRRPTAPDRSAYLAAEIRSSRRSSGRRSGKSRRSAELAEYPHLFLHKRCIYHFSFRSSLTQEMLLRIFFVVLQR